MRRRTVSPFALLALLTSAVACSTAPPDPGEPEPGPPARSYTVRGAVVRLPGPDGSGVEIHHEAVDGFEGIDGNVLGMNAMTMAFPLADGVSLDGIAEGDVVEFVMEVDWNARPQYRVTGIRELPRDTPLEFRRAR